MILNKMALSFVSVMNRITHTQSYTHTHNNFSFLIRLRFDRTLTSCVLWKNRALLRIKFLSLRGSISSCRWPIQFRKCQYLQAIERVFPNSDIFPRVFPSTSFAAIRNEYSQWYCSPLYISLGNNSYCYLDEISYSIEEINLRIQSSALMYSCSARWYSAVKMFTCSSVTDIPVRSFALLQLVNLKPRILRQICEDNCNTSTFLFTLAWTLVFRFVISSANVWPSGDLAPTDGLKNVKAQRKGTRLYYTFRC